MNLVKEARAFAFKVHKGTVRKGQPDVPYIVHPISVYNKLKSYTHDEELLASAILHDVVEDTSYTIDDIRSKFGSRVATLVSFLTEPSKSLSWEERKGHTIKTLADAPHEVKMIKCADLIDNLEDMYLLSIINGKKDFSAFRRGEEKSRWYYTSLYDSLVSNEDKSIELFRELKTLIDAFFYGKKESSIKDLIFGDNIEAYKSRQVLSAKLSLLLKLNKVFEDGTTPQFIVEFAGTPNSYIASCIECLYQFFMLGGFKVCYLPEFSTSKLHYQKLKIELLNASQSDSDIVLIDKGLCNKLIWFDFSYKNHIYSIYDYTALMQQTKSLSKEFIDALILTKINPEIALQREYLNSISIDEKKYFSFKKDINGYNNSMSELEEFLKNTIKNISIIDTTNILPLELSFITACDILDLMREKYLFFLNESFE